LVVFLLAFVPEKSACVPIAGHPNLPHLFIPNSQGPETRHDFGGTIEGGTDPSPEIFLVKRSGSQPLFGWSFSE